MYINLYKLLSKSYNKFGPGTTLKYILKDMFGIIANGGCSCNSMITKMNKLGPEWCESPNGMKEILLVMKSEHSKRTKDGSINIPWVEVCAKQLIKLACYGSKNR